MWDNIFGWWGDCGTDTAVVRGDYVEGGKRVLALLCEAGEKGGTMVV